MNKLTIGIIEDEIPAARLLHRLIHKLRPDWEILVLPGSVSEAVEWFNTHPHPELLFLDIHLADGNSFDLLSKAKPDSTIIFTTAYNEYALQAFSVNSIDYILKPVDEQRLADAIGKYESLLGTVQRPDDYLSTLLDALQQKREKRYRTRFLIAKSNQYITLQVNEIAYFYSEHRQTVAVAFDGRKYPIDLSLNKLEEQLSPDLYFRVSRKMLLRVEAISKIEPYFNGRIVVKVNPPFEEAVTISEDRITPFKMWLNY